jgi:hypothetical protein
MQRVVMVKQVVHIKQLSLCPKGQCFTLHVSKKNKYLPSYAAEHPQFALHLILRGAPQWG